MTKLLKQYSSKIRILSFILFIIGYILSFPAHAVIFNIVPKAGTTLPTTLTSTTKAYYTVTNLTGTTRSGIYVKYLPPNVVQVTMSATPDLCGSTFTLAPYQSCTLELDVNGFVNANDPDPQHHLFVCLPGCVLCCAGTLYPLNVMTIGNEVLSIFVSPQTVTLPVNSQQAYTATAFFSNGTTLDVTSSVTWASSNPGVASITSSGIVTGFSAGTYIVSATLGEVSGSSQLSTVTAATLVSITVNPQTVTLQVGQQQVYTAIGHYSDGTTFDITPLVTWSSSDPSVAMIDSSGLATAVSAGTFVITATLGAVSGSSQPSTVAPITLVSLSVSPQTGTLPIGGQQSFTATALYSDGSTADVTSLVTWSSSDTNVATINASGLATAVAQGTFVITATLGAISDSTQTFTVRAQTAYVTNINGNSVSQCTVNPATGILFGCSLSTGYSLPEGIVLNPNATLAYVSQDNVVGILKCLVDTSNGALMSCVDSGFSASLTPQGITMNNAGTVLYISNFDNFITTCSIDQTNGQLTGCTNLTGAFNFTTGIVLNDTENYAYISNFVGNTVTRCVVNPLDGSLNTCVNSGATGFSSSDGIGSSGIYLYIGSSTTNTVTKCTIGGTGFVSGCVDSGVGAIFSRPQNIAFTSDGAFAYVPNRTNSTVTRCNVDAITGLFSLCTVTSGIGLNGPTGMALK